jgi:hypothetical protein
MIRLPDAACGNTLTDHTLTGDARTPSLFPAEELSGMPGILISRRKQELDRSTGEAGAV